jgi:hypothetical protein
MLKTMARLSLVLLLIAASALAADVTGTWSFTVESPAGTGNPTFVFKQDGEKLTGTYTGMLGKADVTGTVKGDKIEFEFQASYEGQPFKIRYSGKIESPTQMKGTVQLADLGEGAWTATKK